MSDQFETPQPNYTRPVTEQEARDRLAIIKSVVNQRDPSARTLAVVRMAADGVSLIDLVVEHQVDEARSAPRALGGAA